MKEIISLLSKIESTEDVKTGIKGTYNNFNFDNLSEFFIYGAGSDARNVISQCHANGIKIKGVLDNNTSRHGEDFDGYIIIDPKNNFKKSDTTAVLVGTHRITPATKHLRSLGVYNSIPAWVLQILFPEKFTPHMYYDGWVDDITGNIDSYQELGYIFADKKSLNVLNTYLKFKLTFDPLLLEPIVDELDEYFPKGIISLGNNEIYVDGGAWKGEDIQKFKKKVGGSFKRAYGFEPSTAPFLEMKKNFENDDRVISVNKGLFDRNMVVKFDARETPASKIDDQGTIEIPVISLDEVIGDDPVSYIKLNIEGAEAAALAGAQRVIKTHRPKMAICLYHHPCDLWKLPKIIREMVSDYDYYLRLHDGGVIQLILYAIPKA